MLSSFPEARGIKGAKLEGGVEWSNLETLAVSYSKSLSLAYLDLKYSFSDLLNFTEFNFRIS